MLTTRFTTLLGCSHPLQLAPMGWIGTPQLAAAVTNAGGLGMLPGGEARATLLDEVSAATQGPVGVNFLLPFLDLDAVDAAAASVRLVEFFYGDPDPGLVGRVHAAGALAAWQVGSAAEARAAVAAGCELVVVQGTEAGGHVRGRLALFPLLEQVLGTVGVPVVAAGGIATGRSVAAALAAGADAVRVGTRFAAARESAAHPDYVEALVGAVGEDTVLTEAFGLDWPDAPHRVLRSCVEAAAASDRAVVAVRREGGGDVPMERWSSTPPSADVVGEAAAMALYAGEGVAAVQRVEPAAEIVRMLVDEAETLLARFG
ncbi:MAG: NAD(P)H-dependent flavin oxidoreductase [Gaiellaceae bacterium]